MSTVLSKEKFDLKSSSLERELMAHCYRFMGSMQDSEDMLQETLIRAWGNRNTLQSEEKFRAWMYKIATNICLDQLKKEKRRGMPHLQFSAEDPLAPFPPPVMEPIWLEPFPDDLLPPEDKVSTRDDISLAFVTMLHLLSPQQRAAVILMDVLDWSAGEAAEMLDVTVSAVNSSLYNARKKLKKNSNVTAVEEKKAADISGLLDQYVDAWENTDIEKLTMILTDDAIFSMPPFTCWYQGRDAIQKMVSNALFAGGEAKGVWKLSPARANRQPAFALYQLDPETSAYKAFGLIVLTIEKEKIAEITAFLNPAIFPFFKLPLTI